MATKTKTEPVKAASGPEVAMMDPDSGETYMIPPEAVAEAHLHGFQPALRMADDNGDQYWIPASSASEAQENGLRSVRQDGTPYPAGQTPVVVGRNAGGQPIWGNESDLKTKPETGVLGQAKNFLSGVGDVLEGAVKGTEQFLDPRATPEEIAEGRNGIYDQVMRYPERLVAPQVQEAEQFAEDVNQGHPYEALRHGLGAAIPMLGPQGTEAGTQAAQQVAEGNLAGAAGTVAGNLLLVPASEMAGEEAGFAGRAARLAPDVLRGRFREMVAPRARLETPVAAGGMSPLDRFRAAKGMGVNPDLAQATNAPVPKGAKTYTERSMVGHPAFERTAEGNLQALHQYAGKMLDEAHPDDVSREELGNRAKAATSAHRAALADEPGQLAATNEVLDSLHPNQMSGEEFGTAAQESLKDHHQLMYDRAENYLTGALQRNGAMTHLGNVEEVADKIYNEEAPYFDENAWALKTPGMRQAWDIVNQLKSRGTDAATGGLQMRSTGAPKAEEFRNTGQRPQTSGGARIDGGAKEQASGGGAGNEQPGTGQPEESVNQSQVAAKNPPRELSPAMVAKMRSDLWNLYQSPDLVGSRAEGWLKELTASLDDSLTSPENEKGMTPAEIQKFRAGTSLWKRMKTMYDDPQSPFFSILRSPEPMTAAKTLEGLKPVAARQFREAMTDIKRPDLVGQQQRQTATHLLDPTSNGVDVNPDFTGFRSRWPKVNKEQATELFGADNMEALDALAERAGKTTPYEASKLSKVADAENGTEAYNALFTPGNGALKLAPSDVRLLEQADPDLVPQLKRHALANLFDPSNNSIIDPSKFDMKNFASRWGKPDKELLSSLFNPDEMKKVDDLAEVSRMVHANENPSGTSGVLQPVGEAKQLVSGVAGATAGAMAGGPVGAAVGAAAGPVIENAAKWRIAKAVNDPAVVESVMEHPKPMGLVDAAKETVTTPPPAAAGSTAVGLAESQSPQAQQSTADRMRELLARRNGAGQPQTASGQGSPSTSGPQAGATSAPQLEGISTPPNEGNVTTLEPTAEERNLKPSEAATKPYENQPAAGPHRSSVGVSAYDPQGHLVGQSVNYLPSSPPAGATHEVLNPDGKTVVGHIVAGKYVPLQAKGNSAADAPPEQ